LRLVAGIHYGDSALQHCGGDFEVPKVKIGPIRCSCILSGYNSVHVAQGSCTAD
jgi:hypothetical protein